MKLHSRTAEETISLFHEATEANQRTAALQGNTVVLHEGNAEDVLLTGDIHGNAENYRAIVQKAEMETHARRHLVFQEICHGGGFYPEGGGCRSHQVLEDVVEMKVRYPQRVHHILSNHEMAELTEYPIQKSKQLLNYTFASGLRYCYGARADDVRLAMVGYLESCPLAVRISDKIFFSHSIPEHLDVSGQTFDRTIFFRALDPGSDFVRDGSVYRLVWGRDYRQVNADIFAEIVNADILVTGHDPCLDGCKFPNFRQVVLDCCGPCACVMLIPTDSSVTLRNFHYYVFCLDSEK
ncbi:MAG: metallophosphoesterase [Planctomycetia bacterium]|nr:metallophosphoesterase [Planctomycetia bacterium]